MLRLKGKYGTFLGFVILFAGINIALVISHDIYWFGMYTRIFGLAIALVGALIIYSVYKGVLETLDEQPSPELKHKWFFIAGILLLLVGVYVSTLSGPSSSIYWDGNTLFISFLLMIFGVLLVMLADRFISPGALSKDYEWDALASRLIHRLTINGRLYWAMPLLGLFMIIFIFLYSFRIGGWNGIGNLDIVVILLGICLVLYNNLPSLSSKYGKLLRLLSTLFLFFLLTLFVIMVIPLFLYTIIVGPIRDGAIHPDDPLITYFLTKPVSALLNLIGIESTVDPGTRINYRTSSGGYAGIWIGVACIGIYSTLIFASAFISYICAIYRKLTLRIGLFFVLGIFFSWIANILRMTTIIIAGHYYGGAALMWTHENLGIMIFIFWIAVFWLLLFRFLPASDSNLESNDSKKPDKLVDDDLEASEGRNIVKDSTPKEDTDDASEGNAG